jgi:hypothetical protein
MDHLFRKAHLRSGQFEPVIRFGHGLGDLHGEIARGLQVF